MDIIPYILPECYIDTCIANTLLGLSERKTTHHCHSCNKVCSNMATGKLADRFAVGIIDNDKTQPSYVKQFTSIRKIGHIELFKHDKRHHYIIRIDPAMETFLLDVTGSEKLSLKTYGLPSDLKGLTKLTKKQTIKETKAIKRLTRDLCSNANSEMSTLKRILEYLDQHKYQVCLKTLETI